MVLIVVALYGGFLLRASHTRMIIPEEESEGLERSNFLARLSEDSSRLSSLSTSAANAGMAAATSQATDVFTKVKSKVSEVKSKLNPSIDQVKSKVDKHMRSFETKLRGAVLNQVDQHVENLEASERQVEAQNRQMSGGDLENTHVDDLDRREEMELGDGVVIMNPPPLPVVQEEKRGTGHFNDLRVPVEVEHLSQADGDPHLTRFLSGDKTLLDPAAESCQKEFVGWELFDRWRGARRQWCLPPSAQAGEHDQGELGCAKLAIPQHGNRYVCDGHNLSVAFDLAEGSNGGEELDNVMGQAEQRELLKYKDGFLSAQCTMAEANLHPEGLQPAGKDWIGSFQASKGPLQCSEWIEEPVVVVSRVEYANFYHTMTDFVGAWSATVVAGEDPRKVRILLADGHPVSPFDSAWRHIFNPHHPVLRKGDLLGRRVCLRRVVFALYGYASPMTINWFRPDPCKTSAWLASFAQQVLSSYSMQEPSSRPFSSPLLKPNVTLILREDYVAHPRDQGGGKRHNKISNPEELLNVMKNIPEINAQTVQMAFLSFEEQLALVRNTNIFIGMHGAGLTFLPFLSDDAVVIELVPKQGMQKYHFQNLAAWSGKGFIMWRNAIPGNEPNAFETIVDAGQFKSLIEKAVKMLKDRLSDQ